MCDGRREERTGEERGKEKEREKRGGERKRGEGRCVCSFLTLILMVDG